MKKNNNWKVEDDGIRIQLPPIYRPHANSITYESFHGGALEERSLYIKFGHLDHILKEITDYLEKDNGRKEKLDSGSYQETRSSEESAES